MAAIGWATLAGLLLVVVGCIVYSSEPGNFLTLYKPSTSNGIGSPEEGDALKKLYEALSGETWTNSWDWSSPNSWDWSSPNHCNFFGVTCGEDGRVQALVLPNNNMRGMLTDLTPLTALERVDFHGNFLQGPLVRSRLGETAACGVLKELDVSGNQLYGPLSRALRSFAKYDACSPFLPAACLYTEQTPNSPWYILQQLQGLPIKTVPSVGSISYTDDSATFHLPQFVFDPTIMDAVAFFKNRKKLNIHADEVFILGAYDGRGNDVDINGRSVDISARVVYSEGGVLDVSGATIPQNANLPPDCQTENDPACNGQEGPKGGNGGSVTIHAYELVGPLTVLANGAQGTRGQPGGNGRNGNNGADAPLTIGDRLQWENIVGSFAGFDYNVEVSDFSCDIIRGSAFRKTQCRKYTLVTGGQAENGVKAGTAGKAGDGGDGGTVVVGIFTEATVMASAEGGTPAEVAVGGQPGSPGAGGQNSRVSCDGDNRKCSGRNVKVCTPLPQDGQWHTSPDVTSKCCFLCSAEAVGPSGRDGEVGPPAEPPAPGVDGQAGHVTTSVEREALIEALREHLDEADLWMIANRADLDAINGNTESSSRRWEMILSVAESSDQVYIQSSQRLNNTLSGYDFFGHTTDYVPNLDLSTILTYTQDLMESLKYFSQSRDRYFAALTEGDEAKRVKTEQLQDALAVAESMKKALVSQKESREKKIEEWLEALKVADDQMKDTKAMINETSADLKHAIYEAQKLKFGDVLNIISAGIGFAAGVKDLGGILDSIKKVEGMAELGKQMKKIAEIASKGKTFVDEFTKGYEKSQASPPDIPFLDPGLSNTLGEIDLLLMENEVEEFIHPLLDQFKEARALKRYLSDFIGLGRIRLGYIRMGDELKLQVADLNSQQIVYQQQIDRIKELQEAEGDNFNPGERFVQIFMEMQCSMYKTVIIRALGDLAKAYQFWDLRPYRLNIGDMSLDSLLKAHDNLKGQIRLRLEDNRQDHEYSSMARDPHVYVSKESFPSLFEDFADTGRIQTELALPEFTSAIWGTKVKVLEVRVLLYDDSNELVTGDDQTALLEITHSGNSYYHNSSGDAWHFSHDHITRDFKYCTDKLRCNLNFRGFEALTTSQIYSEFGTNYQYIRFSPYTSWEVKVPVAKNPGLDLSKISKLLLEFDTMYIPTRGNSEEGAIGWGFRSPVVEKPK